MATIILPSDGITGGYQGQSLTMKITIATLAGVTWYNAFELIILILVNFAPYHGLYFWSLLISSAVGLIPYSLGFLLKFLNLTTVTWLPITLLTVGWWALVTGQSLVLYSRLHLVLDNQRVLQRVLLMILVNAVLLLVPSTVSAYGANLTPPSTSLTNYKRAYDVMEKIQMTGFCIQEFIISGLYLRETMRLLRTDADQGKRKILYQLLLVNLMIIIMNVGLLVAEFHNYYIMETMLRGTFYSIKLKLEFAVLGKLVEVVQNPVWKPESFSSPRALPDFVDASRVTSDLTRAAPVDARPMRAWLEDDISIAMFEHMPPSEAQMMASTKAKVWHSETQFNGASRAIDFSNPFHPEHKEHHQRQQQERQQPTGTHDSAKIEKPG
ncbi:Uncharacterized protein PECH_008960 [Penicillium ucsense]|uniref:DUF7703 domain-containing protein n=1 Tax=Penicillium ucsense TaxID=2839758 RepID=A0A8J8WGD2_9EURO|nr:Uncharacterized protein PECM_008652 [Penicillium ucsense]KAF7733812.1 Uncharacterized protein PECH_008960 [Penicillium ucsense]